MQNLAKHIQARLILSTLLLSAFSLSSTPLLAPTAQAANTKPPCDFSSGIYANEVNISLNTFVGLSRTPQDYADFPLCDPHKGVTPPTGWTLDQMIQTFNHQPDAPLNVAPRDPATPPPGTSTPRPSSTPRPTAKPSVTPSLTPSPQPSSSSSPRPLAASGSDDDQTSTQANSLGDLKIAGQQSLITSGLVALIAIGLLGALSLGWLLLRQFQSNPKTKA
jgi:hypothetical protein